MAERRMFAKTIVLSDAFLNLPMSARCLYFTLSMLADDDGFVNAPRSIMRQCGASEDDMSILAAKKFVIVFPDGILVIKHWRINNYLRSDRYTETKYIDKKKALVVDENGSYRINASVDVMNVGIPDGIPSIGKVSIDKDSIDKSISIAACECEKKITRKSRIKETDNPMFNRFYEAYPKHISGDYARKCFERIDPDEELLDTMLKAIERQKKTEQWQNIRYIPNPSTWLNEKKWNDEIPDDALVGRSKPIKQVTAQQYTQRQYTEQELLSVSDDLLEAARKARNE